MSVDLTPKGLINEDGNYILQQDDMYGLLKYIWSGLLLPVSEQEYIMRLNLSQETIGLVDSALGPLIGAYVAVSPFCFREVHVAERTLRLSSTARRSGPAPIPASPTSLSTSSTMRRSPPVRVPRRTGLTV